MIAALVVAVCLGGQCDAAEPASWIDPTPAELRQCAERAAKLRQADIEAVCELRPE